MKEANLRKLHRYSGLILAIFIVFQVGTGLLMSVKQLMVPGDVHEHVAPSAHQEPGGEIESRDIQGHDKVSQHATTWNWVKDTAGSNVMTIHHGGGLLGQIYRILLGTGILFQTAVGILIFLRIRSRARK